MPDAWREFKLGDLLTLRRERAHGSEQLLSVTRDRGVVPQADAGRRDISSKDKSGYLRVYPDDIVYNTMRMWQGVVARSDFNGIVSPAYTVCRPTSLADAHFLAHKLKHPAMITHFYRLSQGLVSDTWNLKYHSFASLPVKLPEVTEQRKIVEILDATDGLIATNEQMLQKLSSERSGMLLSITANNHINSTLADVLVGTPKNGLYKPASEYSDSGIPIVRIDSIMDGEIISLESMKRVRVSLTEQSMFAVEPGDILVNRVNSIDLVGKSAIVRGLTEPAVYESNIMRCRVNPDFARSAYVVLWLTARHAMAHFRSSAKSAIAQASINQKDVESCPLALPALSEQDALMSGFERIRQLIILRQKEITKLRMLKQALLDDLLTGRVRIASVSW